MFYSSCCTSTSAFSILKIGVDGLGWHAPASAKEQSLGWHVPEYSKGVGVEPHAHPKADEN